MVSSAPPSGPAAATVPMAVVGLRAALFLAVVFWMQLGPVWHQVLGHRPMYATNTWRMYHGAAINVCDARFFTVDANGARTRIDRFAALGLEHWYDARRNTRLIEDERQVRNTGARICREYLDKGVELHVEARCASRAGWKPVPFDGAVACTGRGRR